MGRKEDRRVGGGEGERGSEVWEWGFKKGYSNKKRERDRGRALSMVSKAGWESARELAPLNSRLARKE